MSAVGTIVSAGYGSLCGAYMPISSFSKGLQTVLSYSPGTYGTSLLRNHTMNGALRELTSLGLPEYAITAIRDGVDCNIYFNGRLVSIPVMYIVLTVSVLLLIGLYILLNAKKKPAHQS